MPTGRPGNRRLAVMSLRNRGLESEIFVNKTLIKATRISVASGFAWVRQETKFSSGRANSFRQAIRWSHASTRLEQLLAFVGLYDAVGLGRGLPLESGGQAEERKHACGVE